MEVNHYNKMLEMGRTVRHCNEFYINTISGGADSPDLIKINMIFAYEKKKGVYLANIITSSNPCKEEGSWEVMRTLIMM